MKDSKMVLYVLLMLVSLIAMVSSWIQALK